MHDIIYFTKNMTYSVVMLVQSTGYKVPPLRYQLRDRLIFISSGFVSTKNWIQSTTTSEVLTKGPLSNYISGGTEEIEATLSFLPTQP